MFKVYHKTEHRVRTVYAADRATNAFLVTDWWDDFEWIPISEYELYIPENEEEK
jgi:hypothetical protein